MAYIKGQFDVTQHVDSNGDPAASYILKFFVWNTSTPTAVYSDSSGTSAGTEITLNSLGQPQSSGGTAIDLFFDDAVTYKAQLYQSDGTTTVGPVIGPFDAGRFGDASNITYTPDGAGAVATDVQTKLREYVSPQDFGAVGDGVTDDTAALNNFFNHCITNSISGHIVAGTYLITLGSLAFDNAHVTTAWPKITTDGFEAVTFKAASNTDNPFIKISNGTAVSGVGKFWQGGSLGGITFEKASGSASGNTNNHGLVLIGIENTEFGYMAASELGGDTVHIEQKLYGGNNPDPYNVSRCVFEGVEGVSNYGWAFNNNNYVGFNGCFIKKIRAISNVSGVYNGMGAANRVETISAGSCGGWGIGDQSDVAGGASTRFLLDTAEFDDIENGIDTTIAANCDFGIVRFVHRHEFSSLNPAGGYWPRTALKIGNASRAVNMLTFNVIHRIESGGVKGDMGEFADFVSAGGNLNDVTIRSQVLDNASFGFTNSDMFTNFSLTSVVHYINNDELIIDSNSYNHTYVKARNSGATAVPSGGFTSGSNWVAYDTAVEGETDNYNTGTYEYTVPAEGVYSIKATLVLALGAGNRVRMAIYRNAASVVASQSYAVTANAEIHTVEGRAYLNVGDVIKINADQNSGAGVTTSAILSANDSYLVINKV